MAERNVRVWYDMEGDYLEVSWGAKESATMEPTADDRVTEKIDEDGHVLGFAIFGVTKLDRLPLEVELGGTPPPVLIGTEAAASELGITPRRLRQLLSEGRVEGAVHVGHDWVIPSPAKITPGSRGPIGAAGGRQT